MFSIIKFSSQQIEFPAKMNKGLQVSLHVCVWLCVFASSVLGFNQSKWLTRPWQLGTERMKRKAESTVERWGMMWICAVIAQERSGIIKDRVLCANGDKMDKPAMSCIDLSVILSDLFTRSMPWVTELEIQTTSACKTVTRYPPLTHGHSSIIKLIRTNREKRESKTEGLV